VIWGPFFLLLLAISYLRKVDGIDMDFIHINFRSQLALKKLGCCLVLAGSMTNL
jgi:hypothetical protein